MIRRVTTALGCAGLLGLAESHAAAQDPAQVTGITSIGPGLALSAIALGLILTLILRPTVNAVSQAVASSLGRRRMTRLLRAGSAQILDNFIVPGAYGGLTRIDHAALVAGGIVCVQTRHVAGSIAGKPDDPQWTHTCGRQRRRFLNPKIQNEGRVAALRKIVPDVPIVNLVVFTGKVTFETPQDPQVIHIDQLRAFMDALHLETDSGVDWDTLWLTLRSAALTDEASRKDFDAQLSFS